MESTRPIRALARGLDALTVLNVRDGATVSEVAQEIRLPRTTVYRILETLCGSGFVSRDNADDRYRLTIRVRTLSTGVDDEEWIARVAKPCLAQLGKDIVWPVSIATLSGTRMIRRESTDHGTPLAIDRYATGFRLDLAASSAGRIFLAFCDATDRDRLIQVLSLNPTVKADVAQALEETRSQGFCSTSRTRRQLAETSLSVPVRLGASAATPSPAVLTLRYLSSALPAQSAQERFLPKLRECAAKIADQVSEQQAAGRHQRPPQAAS